MLDWTMGGSGMSRAAVACQGQPEARLCRARPQGIGQYERRKPLLQLIKIKKSQGKKDRAAVKGGPKQIQHTMESLILAQDER
jgi:hypothetical protein